MTKEISYPITIINEEKRRERITFNITRGNHSVLSKEVILKMEEFIKDKLNKGLLIPILK